MNFRSELVVLTAIAVSMAAGCGSDDEKDSSTDPTDAGAGSGGEGGSAGTPTGGSGGSGGTTGGSGGTGGAGGATAQLSVCEGKTGADLTACGEYLVKHLDACGDCHSPRLPTGAIDESKFLAGDAAFADVDPTSDTLGLVPTPNLTRLGAEGWTAEDVKNAFQNGERPTTRGGGLFPIMPYFVFHNMADIDADAIAAYILSLTPIANDIPTRQPFPEPIASLPLPVPPFDAAQIPDSTLPASDPNYASAQLGKYLAAEAGICMECHTPRTPVGALDPSLLFAGGESFVVGGPFGTVTALNVTPATSGIDGWTPEQVRDVLLLGVDDEGSPICPPMPAGPMQAFGGLEAAHALAIGHYLTSLPPVENPGDGGTLPNCEFPGPPPQDDGGAPEGGASDSGAPDAGGSLDGG